VRNTTSITGVVFILLHQMATHFSRFWGFFSGFLCIKAVHNLKQKVQPSSTHHPWAMFVPTSAFLLCLGFWGSVWRMCSIDVFGLFLAVLANFATIKKLSFQKSKCAHHPHTRRHLYAEFDVLRPSQFWDRSEKKQSPNQTPTQLISTVDTREPMLRKFIRPTMTTMLLRMDYTQYCSILQQN